jgi:hydroxymethylbilane synthase
MPERRRVATRTSALAMRQAGRVVELLGEEVRIIPVSTSGDERADTPIHAMGGTGVFVKEVQQAVLDGLADFAVHSAKDLPATPTPGLTIAAVPERADPHDALVGSRLDDLPTAARVATGSVRRRAQLAAYRPDLTFAELRGNIATRLEKAAGFDAIVVAAAALERLDLLDRAAEILPRSIMLPQVGQGALAVECRVDDDDALALLATIDNPVEHRLLRAERAFLARLGAGCDLPCAASASLDDDDVFVEGVIASLDGRILLRDSAADPDPVCAGQALAERLLGEGGANVLAGEGLR